MAHVQCSASEDDWCLMAASQTIMLLYGSLGLWPVVGYVNGRVYVLCLDNCLVHRFDECYVVKCEVGAHFLSDAFV